MHRIFFNDYKTNNLYHQASKVSMDSQLFRMCSSLIEEIFGGSFRSHNNHKHILLHQSQVSMHLDLSVMNTKLSS